MRLLSQACRGSSKVMLNLTVMESILYVVVSPHWRSMSTPPRRRAEQVRARASWRQEARLR